MAEKITPRDLAEKKSDFVLIDVREADEVAEDGGATIEDACFAAFGCAEAARSRQDRRDGPNIYYAISNPKIVKAFNLMREVLLEQLQKDQRIVAETHMSEK